MRGDHEGGDYGDPAWTRRRAIPHGDFSNPQYGKVREALLRYTEWARAFTAQSRTGSYRPRQHRGSDLGTGRDVAAFAHGLQLVRTRVCSSRHKHRAAGLVAPEMQMTNVSTVVGYMNYMQGAIGSDANNGLRPVLDLRDRDGSGGDARPRCSTASICC